MLNYRGSVKHEISRDHCVWIMQWFRDNKSNLKYVKNVNLIRAALHTQSMCDEKANCILQNYMLKPENLDWILQVHNINFMPISFIFFSFLFLFFYFLLLAMHRANKKKTYKKLIFKTHTHVQKNNSNKKSSQKYKKKKRD